MALKRGDSRLVIMAPAGSEVYVDDERYGSVGRSGRVILTSLAPGQHVLRVSRTGEADDERVIEIRKDIAEQIIDGDRLVLKLDKDSPSILTITANLAGAMRRQSDAMRSMNNMKQLALAMEFSTTRNDYDLYSAKLARMSSSRAN